MKVVLAEEEFPKVPEPKVRVQPSNVWA